MRRKALKPTERELAILKILWMNGPATVRQVHEQIQKKQPTGYTTTLKFMQIMNEKGLLSRTISSGKHIYQPEISESQIQKGMLTDVMEKVFSGSASKLVMNLFSDGDIPDSEMSKIKDYLDNLDTE